MIEIVTEPVRFKQQLTYSLQQETLLSPTLSIAKNNSVYRSGESAQSVYFIESGQIKLLMRSTEEKDCLLAILASGDIFGELCLSGSGARMETAIAMEETALKQISRPKFFARLEHDALFVVGFVQYLAVRLADQQQLIANLATVSSEQRLGMTLLRLAHALGKKDPYTTRIELRITHEELSEMVGTTRPRISVFMQHFRNLGLIETNPEHFLIINEEKLTSFLARAA